MSENENASQRLRNGLTKQFLDIIENGEVATNKGEAVLDKNGDPIRIAPSAAMLGQVQKWLDRLEKSPENDDDFSRRLRELAEQAGNDSYPDLADDSEDDPATT